MSDNPHSRLIYVEIDTLFDLRLATIATERPESFDKVIEDGYFERERDHFPTIGLPYEEFKDLMVKANRPEILMSSLRTYIFEMVIQNLVRFHEELIGEPFRGFPMIHLNTYPYVFEEETKDHFRTLFQEIAKDIPVFMEWVFKDPKELDPIELGDKYSVLYMYSPLEWMNSQNPDKLLKSKLYMSDLFAPGLFQDKEQQEEQWLDPEQTVKIHPFTAIRMLAKRLVNLRFIPAKYFSAVCPDNTLDEDEVLNGEDRGGSDLPVDTEVGIGEGYSPFDPNALSRALQKTETEEYVFGEKER